MEQVANGNYFRPKDITMNDEDDLIDRFREGCPLTSRPLYSVTISIKVLVILLVFLMSGCERFRATLAFSSEEERPQENGRYRYLEQSNAENHKAGTVESIIEYGDTFAIGVHYPVFDNEGIDASISQFVDMIIIDFKSILDDYEPIDSDFKAELNVDYKAFKVGDRLVNVEFIILMNMPGYAHPDVRSETLVCDLEKERPVVLKDILHENGLPKLADIAKNELLKQPDYNGYLNEQQFHEGTAAVEGNYSRFLLTKNGFVLVFQKYQVFAGAAGEPRVEIPYEDLHDILDLRDYNPAGFGDSSHAETLQELWPHPSGYRNRLDGNPLNEGFREKAVDLERRDGRPLRTIDPQLPMVALTFDDGPFPQCTGSILDTLKSHDAAATFFVLGNRVADNADLLKRMVDEGHEIGNHSLSHKRLVGLSAEELDYQIEKTQILIESVTGSRPAIMRPTYGSYNDELRRSVTLPMILWSIDTRDWESRNAVSVKEHVLDKVQDGDIILMHDIYMSTAKAVEMIVPELKNRGYQIVTVSELYSVGGVALEAGNVYRVGEKGF